MTLEVAYTPQKVTIAAGNEARVVYDVGGLFKPHIPFLAPAGGGSIVLPSPYDHVFHRGLFLCWQKINDVAAWYDRDDGSGGCRWETDRFHPAFTEENTIVVHHDLRWVYSDGRGDLLGDARAIRFHFPDDGALHVDFDFTFTALTDEVTLHANQPYQRAGESIQRGGYGGLSLRLLRGWKRDVFDDAGVFSDGGLSGQLDVNGRDGRWVASEGPTDRGFAWAGAVLLDHPENPRHPMTMFARDEGNIAFLNAAFTYREPWVLQSGQTLRLRYRVIAYPGHREPGDIEQWMNEYHQTEASAAASASR